ncbi:Rossmann-like and DUF2520 domain-containing protein [Prevotella merdae]|uniref:Rossmann-like and DUF2520 domain-containing protein n=1 Tax=Prevotella merdae TaxID=2079531 RepID=UPI003F7E04CE
MRNLLPIIYINHIEKMKTVIVGAGNVATHIAKTLAAHNCAPVQIWSRHADTAAVLAREVGSKAVARFEDIDTDSDVYIVSVADQALEGVIKDLCRCCKQGVFVHTAGTMSMDLFEGECNHYGVLYPMQTFSKDKALDFKKVPCFVEASDQMAYETIMQLANTLSDNVHRLEGKDRKWLHVAAVFACNFANACYTMAERILREHGLDFDVMLPLVDETTAKLHSMSPVEAQTGPAARNDHNVMNRHMDMLKDNADMQAVYRMMSEIIMNRKK